LRIKEQESNLILPEHDDDDDDDDKRKRSDSGLILGSIANTFRKNYQGEYPVS